MGIPYSKDLVAAASEVLKPTKYILSLLACIQVLIVLLLTLILLALVGLMVTLNPDLKEERRRFVTPMARWLIGWVEVGRGGVGAARRSTGSEEDYKKEK